ncbi:MAG: hypothetical protein EOP38_08405 [Rubrivivax sp.]|nr:MAG: hypothetical protein EOP38_08405 [Rubrivivax sp.]
MNDIPRPRKTWRASLWRPFWLITTLLLAVILLLVGGWWGLHREAPTARLLSVLPWVKVEGPRGGLLQGFSATRLEISLPRGSSLVLLEPRWEGVVFRHDATVAWKLGLSIDTLQARSAQLHWVAGPPATVASPPPTEFDLPLSVRLGSVRIGALRSNLFEPQIMEGLDLRLALQAAVGRSGHQHEVVLHHLAVHGWQLQGRGTLGTRRAMDTDVSLDAVHPASGAGRLSVGEARLRLKGPLQHMAASGQVQLGQGTEVAQSLNVSGEVAPFEAWPVPRLSAQAHGLDLSVLWPALPGTALSGQVSVQPTPDSAKRSVPDLAVNLALDNLRPGPWDAHGLPITRLAGQVALPVASAGDSAGKLGSLGQAGQLTLTVGVPRMGARPTVGTIAVSGTWDLATPQKTSLRAEVRGLEPQALDGRAPPLQLQGQMAVRAAGPSAVASAEQAASMPGQAWARWAVSADLSGQYSKGPGTASRPVSIKLAGHLSPTLIEVAQLDLSSGTAVAKLTGQAEQPAADSPWRAKGELELADFDPQLWLPWPDKAKGINRLQGQVQFDVDTAGQGEVTGRLDPSQLGSVPLDGQWAWKAPAGRPDMDLKADLNVGGNHIGAAGTMPVNRPATGGIQWATDRAQQWQFQIQAPAVQALQPVAQWWGWHDLQGKVQGELSVSGVWPAMSSQGQLEVTGLQAKSPTEVVHYLGQAQGRWKLNASSASAPSEARLSLRQARVGSTVAEQFNLALDGSAQSHRVVVQGDLHLPGGGESADRPGPVPRVHLDLAVAGSLLDAFSGWRGQVQRLSVLTIEPKPRTLLSTEAVDVHWASTPDENHLEVSPARLTLMGAGLKIQELLWREPRREGATGGQTKVSIDLEPIKLADVLARWQPDAGWGGDLLVVGQLRMQHSDERPWQVDGYLARREGDLSLSETAIEGAGVQPLGIRQGRLELKARDGVWTLSEQFDGRVLGLVTGQQTVRSRSPASLPSPDDSLSGTLNVKIANLRPWGVWAPPGWRLAGQLQADAALSGTLGAPLYKGQVNGQNLGASHALMGVNITDGVLQLSLDGDHARLSQLKARGGEKGGTISLEGDAVLGAQPEAHLNLLVDHFALLQRVDRRGVVSGQAQVVLGAEDLKADGRFVVDEGLVDISKSDAPTIGDDVNVVNRPGGLPQDSAEAEVSSAPPSKRKLQVTMDVDLGSKLRLKGRGLNALLVGKLRLTTPNGRPAVHGTVRAESGSYVAYAQNLVIERGSISFTGPIENPRLDILAMRAESPTAASEDVKVGVTITGTAQDPRVRLYSDPSMSETEQLSWLVLGRGPAGLGGADIGLLQTAASALLAGEGGSPKDSVLGAIGLDDLSVRQSDVGDTRETVVNVGKQISRKWYLGYERSLNATAGNWQLIYRLAQRFTLRAQAGQDNALDLIWSWRFD